MLVLDSQDVGSHEPPSLSNLAQQAIAAFNFI
jgi:hypothetical protein